MKRLYESWDDAFMDEVEGFNPNEKSQKCFQEFWLSQPPNILFFSLNRVQYDKRTNNIVKKNTFFQFDKVIYADMFLHKNRSMTMKVREKVKMMKERIKEINNNLA
jgi:hypothetical protein